MPEPELDGSLFDAGSDHAAALSGATPSTTKGLVLAHVPSVPGAAGGIIVPSTTDTIPSITPPSAASNAAEGVGTHTSDKALTTPAEPSTTKAPKASSMPEGAPTPADGGKAKKPRKKKKAWTRKGPSKTAIAAERAAREASVRALIDAAPFFAHSPGWEAEGIVGHQESTEMPTTRAKTAKISDNRKSVVEYKTRWLDHPESEDTWETKESFRVKDDTFLQLYVDYRHAHPAIDDGPFGEAESPSESPTDDARRKGRERSDSPSSTATNKRGRMETDASATVTHGHTLASTDDDGAKQEQDDDVDSDEHDTQSEDGTCPASEALSVLEMATHAIEGAKLEVSMHARRNGRLASPSPSSVAISRAAEHDAKRNAALSTKELATQSDGNSVEDRTVGKETTDRPSSRRSSRLKDKDEITKPPPPAWLDSVGSKPVHALYTERVNSDPLHVVVCDVVWMLNNEPHQVTVQDNHTGRKFIATISQLAQPNHVVIPGGGDATDSDEEWEFDVGEKVYAYPIRQYGVVARQPVDEQAKYLVTFKHFEAEWADYNLGSVDSVKKTEDAQASAKCNAAADAVTPREEHILNDKPFQCMVQVTLAMDYHETDKGKLDAEIRAVLASPAFGVKHTATMRITMAEGSIVVNMYMSAADANPFDSRRYEHSFADAVFERMKRHLPPIEPEKKCRRCEIVMPARDMHTSKDDTLCMRCDEFLFGDAARDAQRATKPQQQVPAPTAAAAINTGPSMEQQQHINLHAAQQQRQYWPIFGAVQHTMQRESKHHVNAPVEQRQSASAGIGERQPNTSSNSARQQVPYWPFGATVTPPRNTSTPWNGFERAWSAEPTVAMAQPPTMVAAPQAAPEQVTEAGQFRRENFVEVKLPEGEKFEFEKSQVQQYLMNIARKSADANRGLQVSPQMLVRDTLNNIKEPLRSKLFDDGADKDQPAELELRIYNECPIHLRMEPEVQRARIEQRRCASAAKLPEFLGNLVRAYLALADRQPGTKMPLNLRQYAADIGRNIDVMTNTSLETKLVRQIVVGVQRTIPNEMRLALFGRGEIFANVDTVADFEIMRQTLLQLVQFMTPITTRAPTLNCNTDVETVPDDDTTTSTVAAKTLLAEQKKKDAKDWQLERNKAIKNGDPPSKTKGWECGFCRDRAIFGKKCPCTSYDHYHANCPHQIKGDDFTKLKCDECNANGHVKGSHRCRKQFAERKRAAPGQQ